MNLPDLNAMMRFWIGLLGLDKPDQYSGKPWRITWNWADTIPHPTGGDAVGLNTGNGKTQTAHISIRKPRSEAELRDLDDTCCHEVNHCVGLRMEALLNEGRDVDAHEYLAETYSPAMVKIKGTPKAKSLAKAARQLPARAKGPTRMDSKAILAMLAMVMAASTPEEKEKLLSEMKTQLEGQSGNGEATPMPAEPPPALGAEPPKPEEKKADPPPALGMGEPDRYKKLVADSIDTILEMRPDLSDAQKQHVRGLPTVDAAKTYFKAHPMAAKAQDPKGPQLGIPAIPRGGEDTSKAAPSGDKHTMKLFRIMGGAKSEMGEGDGIELFDPKTSGKLVRFSVVDAFNVTREATAANVQLAKAKMLGGAA